VRSSRGVILNSSGVILISSGVILSSSKEDALAKTVPRAVGLSPSKADDHRDLRAVRRRGRGSSNFAKLSSTTARRGHPSTSSG
jgi:hypothetical protein